jgi:hypothetical protein
VTSTRIVALAFLAFLLAGGLLLRATPWPAPFDELQHVSLAAAATETGSVRPRVEAQFVLDPADFSRWTTDRNYIGHPLFYYALIGPLLDRSLPPLAAVQGPRIASFAMVAAGAGLGLLAALRLVGAVPAALAMAALMALAPLRLQVGVQVNNDALAMLGGGLALLGLTRPGRLAAVMLVAGILCAMGSKPSAGLLVGGFAGLAALLARDGRLLAMVVAAGLVGLLPYLDLLARYGSVIPITFEALTGEAASPMAPLDYALRFGRQFLTSWTMAETGHPLVAAAFGSVLALALAGGGMAAARLRHPVASRSDVLAAAAVATFAGVVLVQFAYGAASLGGSLGAASLRYHLPLWPMLAHAMAVAVIALSRRGQAAALAVAMLALVGALVT